MKHFIRPFFLVAFLFLIITIGVAADNSAQAAVVMDVRTGRLLYEKNADTPLEMASTTKIMTALLAVESGRLDEVITIKPEWCGIEGSSIYLKPNEKYTLRALTYGLMLRSGNDASVAIACTLGGTIENFANRMNTRAKELGATHTHFTNPNGLPDTQHYTSARDLALITAHALKNPEFAKIVNTKQIHVKNENISQTFINKNKLLWEYEGANGVKTGYTKRAGKCLVSSAERNGLWVTCVVINCPSMWPDSKTLLDAAFHGYQNKLLVDGQQLYKPVRIQHGKQHYAATKPACDFSYPLKTDGSEKAEIKFQYLQSVSAPVVTGDYAGQIELYVNHRLVGSVDMEFVNAVKSNSIPYYFKNLLKLL